ncbi:MAG: SMP-30/gluconolactonase/LRE family protein [Candidatus Zipacnadales bacterium]
MIQLPVSLEEVIAPDAQVERVATGFQFTEGPAWAHGALYFSDIPADTIYRLTEAGEVNVFLKPSGKSNGLMFDRDGTLVACRHWERDLARITMDGNLTVLAHTYQGKKLNSPNDCIIAADGAIYFTDPHYGLEGRPKEQNCEGVYRLGPDGTLRRVVEDMTRPNGIYLSPDGQTLYVADSQDRKLRAYTVEADGSVTDGRDFIDMRVQAEGVPDGMTMDTRGVIYCTGGGGIWVITPEGKHLGTIPVPEVPANCTFGGADHNVLYITARSSVYRVSLRAVGFCPPPLE